MKSIIPKNNKPEKQIVKKAEVKQEYKMIGSMKYRPGLTLFEFNTVTGELSVAEIKKTVSVDFKTGKPKRKFEVEHKKDCWYLYAFNMDNAERKLKNIYKQFEKEKNYVESK